MNVVLIIPAMNEATAIPLVLANVPRDVVDHVIVVDNASTDATAAVARAAGADVVTQPLAGYGYACYAGVVAAADADVVAFIDGDGSFDVQQVRAVVQPILDGRADFVLGSRELGGAGSQLLHQRLGNLLVAWLLRRLYRTTITDISALRAIRRSSLITLDLQERTFGWTTEMVIKAAKHGIPILEVPASYGARIGGESKVSGTLRGTLHTAYRMLALTAKHIKHSSRSSS